MNLREIRDLAIAALQAKKEELEVATIEAGKTGLIPAEAPFVLVFASPKSIVRGESPRTRLRTATIDVFAGFASYDGNVAIHEANELAENCLEILLDEFGSNILNFEIDFDSVFADKSMVNLSIEIAYRR